MSEERVKRKLTAILSADVVGYSRLMGEDEVSTVRTLEAYRKVISDLIEQFRGRVVDSPGDNLLSEFSSVVDAVQCAVEIHEVIRAKNEELPEDRRMLFRIGVNLGDVIEEGDRIYGDGVNIAARLEGLAEAGGICISGSAHEQIKNKLALGYEFIGEHTVKNIAEPLKVYRVPVGPKVATPKEGDDKETKLKKWRWTAIGAVGVIVIIGALAIWNFYLRGPSIEPASIDRMAYPLPEKPSIAVLPFTNMSGDPEQEYIGDGLSENIISALSVSSQIFVMARNATFTYKGTAVKPQQVAEELGVQYILEGSIQKSGNQLRVSAQLIDALSGHHLWSEVYDREMRNLFELQDEITKKIMVSLQVVLSGSEEVRVYAKSTDNLEAWKHYIKGGELYENHNAKDNLKAREHFEAAIEIDPAFVAALSKLAQTHAHDFIFEWGDSPFTSLNRAFELAQKAVELDEQNPFGHAVLGLAFLYQRQLEKAITEGKRAITLNPNYAYGHVILAGAMHFSGRFDEAITLCKKASRLNPIDPSFYLHVMASSYIFLKRYEEALEAIRQMEERATPGSRLESLAKIHFSWVYEELGKKEEARVYMAEALKIKPDYSLKNIVTDPYKNPAHLQRRIDALRKAGMPEKPPGAVQEKPSIAVLPFDDLSPEKDQEYFVLGLSEEILNYISNISGLHVTSKTSSFAFKDTNKTIKEIAEILERDYILEGSVRKAGNALRVTVQLIRAADDSHLWSAAYDRELEDIFKIQEDIANNVADKLKLTLEAFQLLGGTENIEAYEFYLSAKGERAEGSILGIKNALELIDEAIDLDPEFALAWSFKSHLHGQLSVFESSIRSIEEAEAATKAAQKAIELEPNLGGAYFNLGHIEMGKGEWSKAERNFHKGLELIHGSLSGDDIYIFVFYTAVGNYRKVLELLEEARRNDPIHPDTNAWYCYTYGLLGDRQQAEKEYQRRNRLMPKGYSGWHDNIITRARLGSGDILFRDDIVSSSPIHNEGKKYLDSPEDGLAELNRIYRSDDNLSGMDLSGICIWAAYFGDSQLAMDVIEKSASINAGHISVLWSPIMKEVRQLPRFKQFIREIGLVDYWKKFGWPDICRPIGDDDFVCE